MFCTEENKCEQNLDNRCDGEQCERYKPPNLSNSDDAAGYNLEQDIIEHASRLSCNCQKNGPDVDNNRHAPSCIVGKAQIYLGQKVFVEGRL